MLKMAIITGFLGRTTDRFHEYNVNLDLEQKFKLMTEIEGCDGVEIVYPYEVGSPQETRALVEKYGLKIAAVNVNVKAEPEFRNGGITSNKKEVRDKAIRFIKEAKDYAAAVGANKVTCCPLGDGYEFAFQYDYARAWKYLVEAFGEGGAHKPEIPLFIEYKPSETRGRCFVDSASKALCLLNDIQCKDILRGSKYRNSQSAAHSHRCFADYNLLGGTIVAGEDNNCTESVTYHFPAKLFEPWL